MTNTEYAATQNLSTAGIAKLFRADVKAAIKSGAIPKVKLSVNTRCYAGGSSIDIEIKTVPTGFAVLNPERVRLDLAAKPSYLNSSDVHHNPILTVEAKALIDALDKMLAEYNFDGSDSMTDYYHTRFGASRCSFSHEIESLERAALEAILAMGEVATIARDAAVDQPEAALTVLLSFGGKLAVTGTYKGLSDIATGVVARHAVTLLAGQAKALDAKAA